MQSGAKIIFTNNNVNDNSIGFKEYEMENNIINLTNELINTEYDMENKNKLIQNTSTLIQLVQNLYAYKLNKMENKHKCKICGLYS